MRRESVYQSTKRIVSASASTVEELAYLTNDVVKYGRNELRATQKLSDLENATEFAEEKSSTLINLLTQLQEVTAQPDSPLRTAKLAILEEAIATVQAV